MLGSEPSWAPVRVRRLTPSPRDRPKSKSSARPSRVNRTLDGLTSRWSTPLRWAWSTAAATCSTMRTQASVPAPGEERVVGRRGGVDAGGREAAGEGRAELRRGHRRRVRVSEVRQQLAERAPAHALHREVRDAPLFAELVHRDDARVLQARDDLDLPPEALPRAGEVELVGADQLERDLPAEGLLVREVDDAHAAAAEEGEQAEVAEPVGEGGLGGALEQAGVREAPHALTEGVRALWVLAAHLLERLGARLLHPVEALEHELRNRVEGRLVVGRAHRGSGRGARDGVDCNGARGPAPKVALPRRP